MSDIDWMETLGWSEEHIDDLRNAGYSYIRQGKYDIAISFLQALTILDGLEAYDWQTLGGLYLEIGQHERAIKTLETALTLARDHGPTRLNLAKTYLAVGRIGEAIKLAKSLQRDKNKTVASVARALVLAYT